MPGRHPTAAGSPRTPRGGSSGRGRRPAATAAGSRRRGRTPGRGRGPPGRRRRRRCGGRPARRGARTVSRPAPVRGGSRTIRSASVMPVRGRTPFDLAALDADVGRRSARLWRASCTARLAGLDAEDGARRRRAAPPARPANRPTPQYRSSAMSPRRGARPSRTASTRVSAAAGWTCQKPPLPTRHVRPSARSRTKARPWTRWTPPSRSSTRSDRDRLVQLDAAAAGRRAGGEDDLAVAGAGRRRSPRPEAIRGQSLRLDAEFLDAAGRRSGSASIGSTSCERCGAARRGRPASTAYCTRVRQPGPRPSGSLSPAAGITVPSQPASSGVEAGEALQLLGDHLALERALGAGRGVLPVAAAAAARAGERAGRPRRGPWRAPGSPPRRRAGSGSPRRPR